LLSAWRAFDVARPLKRDLLVGTHTGPARDGQVDALEIKVIAGVGQDGERCGASGFQNGLSGAMSDLHTAIQCGVGAGEF
jgi:hypothetical protein